MVYRIYVEKKPGFDGEAQSLRNELVSLLGIKELNGLRLLNRYDVEGIDEALFEQCVPTVFSEPPVDNTYAELPVSDGVSFAVEYLPGQFDQRADSAAECIQLISQGDRPLVRSARVYLLEGTLTDEQVAEIKTYVVNPVEAREASLDTRATLKMEHPVPTEVEVLDGFNELDEAGLKKFIDEKGLAMDLGDIKFCQEYFRSEKRDPTITEIKMIDTYWSDHCRHTTFGTILDDVQIDDAVVQEAFDRYMAMRADLGRENKPRCMMDLATIGAKELKKQGILKNLDESEEINACTVKIKCDVNGKDEDWLFLFKNETHNHPTEIEPFGGACQLTPQNAMVAKLPVDGETDTCSGMAWGYNPYLMSANQYVGARMAVVESVTKLVASGFRYEDAYLTFQEYFERLGTSPERWGKPLAALLGALDAQIGLGIASIGGKDSMSGSFEQLDVPPTLVSFATAIGKAGRVVSTEFKKPESTVVLIRPILDPVTGCPNFFSLKANYKKVEQMMEDGMVAAASSVGYGGLAEALFKMGLGNRIGFKMMNNMTTHDMFKPMYGSIVLEMVSDAPAGELLGETTADYTFECCGDKLDMAQLQEIWESKLEPVYPYRKAGPAVEKINGSLTAPAAPKIGVAKPKVIIPVFPGTNCEYDTAHAFTRAGADPEVLVIRNLTPADVTASCEALVKAINESQIVMLPGGFSGGDEPDGSAKFIASFFRNPAVTEAVRDLLQHRDGLMLGICNGFQALIKLGLAAYGDIRPITACDPTLTFNTIGRHQSMLVRTRIASTGSPWLSKCSVGDQHTVAISHGEGRFVAPQSVLDTLIANGQIATQYVDQDGSPSMDMKYNPNGSVLAIEGITSPDGRVFGKMGHSERSGEYLYKNVTGDKYQPIFEGGVDYFKI